MAGILVQCKGPCGQDVNSAECNVDGWCTLCEIMDKATVWFLEYKRLWKRYLHYRKRGHGTASLEKQIGRQVGRIAAICHAKLPVKGAVRLTNEICEKARAEVEGFERILTVGQAIGPEPKTKGRILLPGAGDQFPRALELPGRK